MKNIFDADQENITGYNTKKARKKTGWVEESFYFEKNVGNQIAQPGTKNYIGKSLQPGRWWMFLILLLLALLIISGRILDIQIINGAHYRELAEGNRIRIKPIPAERGIIFDRNGTQLVQNIPNFILAITPQDLPTNTDQRNAVLLHIAEISGINIDDLYSLLKKYLSYSYGSLIIKENLDYQTALKLYIESANMPGMLIEGRMKRDYTYIHENDPENILSLSHILGYTGKISDVELERLQNDGYLLSDNIGKTGIEKQYEKQLRGIVGKKRVEVNASGSEQVTISEDPPTHGNNIYLTIDLEAQKFLEQTVKKLSDAKNKKRISAIAMDSRNGEILAMVSWPSFDNNLFSGDISQENYQKYITNPDKPLFNRAISGSFPSGSIVKLIITAAALQENIIKPSTTFLSVGGIHVDKWFFKDWKAGGHGVTNAVKALAWSVNTFYYYIGGGYKDFVGLGVDRITVYMRRFGLAAKTGIDIPGENNGFLPSKSWKKEYKGEQWYVGDTYNLSIGQGDLLVTPLQAAVWTAAIANGGDVVTPHIGLKSIDLTTKNGVFLQFDKARKHIVSEANTAVVRQGMRACVIEGSCKLLQTLPFASGGKTGTAQWSSTKPEHAWFTSFAPYDNPQIVITVLVEEGGEGSVSAMPIARNFLNWWGKKYLTH